MNAMNHIEINPQRLSEKSGVYITLEELIALGNVSFKRSIPARSTRLLKGRHLSRLRGRGMEFDQVRRYEPGDDIRTMDWRVTARTHKAHTKLFHEEREQPVYLVVDQTESLFFGSAQELKSVTAAKAAAFIAWQTFYHRDRVGGLLVGLKDYQAVKPHSGQRGLHYFFHTLVDYNQALYTRINDLNTVHSTENMHSAFKALLHLAKHGARIIILSDFLFFNTESASLLAGLCQHNQVIGIQIYDPLEQTLPPDGHYPISNGQQYMSIHTATPKLRKAFQQYFSQRQIQLKNSFHQYGASWLTLSTQAPLVDTLSTWLFTQKGEHL